MRYVLAALLLAGCAGTGYDPSAVTTSTPEERAAALQARCAVLDNELVQAQINAVADVERIRARRQQACELAELAYLLLYGIVPGGAVAPVDPPVVPPPA